MYEKSSKTNWTLPYCYFFPILKLIDLIIKKNSVKYLLAQILLPNKLPQDEKLNYIIEHGFNEDRDVEQPSASHYISDISIKERKKSIP